jgi:hypothetical protein
MFSVSGYSLRSPEGEWLGGPDWLIEWTARRVSAPDVLVWFIVELAVAAAIFCGIVMVCTLITRRGVGGK